MSDLFLVGFKGNRKEYYYNNFHHSLNQGDLVIVQVDRGEDCGNILQHVQKKITLPEDITPSTILRPANDEDRAILDENRIAEDDAWPTATKLIDKHELEMKLVDIEYQHDKNKVTFFFTADHRVDFRALVRDLASEYKTRIELRQIGVRDEAKRIGGFGICGLPQCCASFLQKFEPISTQDARIQNLSLNPSKISGNCGRLLCCLKYEVDIYEDIMLKYPEIGTRYSAGDFECVVNRISVADDYMIVVTETGEEIKVYGNELLDIDHSSKTDGKTRRERSRAEESDIDDLSDKPEDYNN